MTEPALTISTPSTHCKRNIVTRVAPYINRTTITIVLALASAFGIIAPEKATQLRDIVLMLPAGSGHLVN